jgi:hypothetical protein
VFKRPKSRSVSAKEVRRVLETTQHLRDEELSEGVWCEVFDLASGGALLVFEDGKGRLYESIDELRAMIDETERKARRGPQSICSDLPQGQNFAEQVPELVRQLATLLKIEPAELDGSEASLDKVDKGLRRLQRHKILTPEVFAPLTAYVGEVIRSATQGQWEMRRGSHVDRTWEPWIVDSSGRSCAPFSIYKELLEYGRSASLRGWVAGTLAMWGHRVAGQP